MKYAYIFTTVVLLICLYRSCNGLTGQPVLRLESIPKKRIDILVEPILEKQQMKALNRSADELICTVNEFIETYEEKR